MPVRDGPGRKVRASRQTAKASFLSGSSLGECERSRVGVCGFKMLGRIDRDTKEIERHRIVSGGQLSEY